MGVYKTLFIQGSGENYSNNNMLLHRIIEELLIHDIGGVIVPDDGTWMLKTCGISVKEKDFNFLLKLKEDLLNKL